jgi:hypothetical protein
MALPSLRFTEERRRERYAGLIGAWGFDEGSGLVAADSALGGTTSASLTVAPGLTWPAGHSVGTALQNGGGGGTGGANVAFNIASSSLTLMGWARPLNLTNGTSRPLFGFWDAADTSGSTYTAIWAQRGDFGTSNVLQGNVRASGLQALNGSALTLNTWVHVAITYDGANMTLYKDGSSVATASQPGAAYTGLATFCVVPDAANAQVDDIRLFNTALSQPEIAAFMTIPVAIP